MSGGPLTQALADKAREVIATWPPFPATGDVDKLLRWIAKWRSQVLAQSYLSKEGPVVANGLFAGMTYVPTAAEGSLLARLLGSYESCLHPHLAAIAGDGLDCVIDVGCAEGYYAVGLARAFPNLVVHARDINPIARLGCEDLAARNQVSDRVIVGGAFGPEDFEAFAGQRVLVFVDAEGAELDVLRPDLAPALSGMSIIVETHDVFRPGALATLTERFAESHLVTRVDQELGPLRLPDWMSALSELDQLLTRWEWRYRMTPWLVMRPRSPPEAG